MIRTGEPISTEDMAEDRPCRDDGPHRRVADDRAGHRRTAAGRAPRWSAPWPWAGRPEHADEYHSVDPRLPASFAEQAALALQVVRSRETERRLALFEDRDRIGRDLHDLVIQRLFAVGLSLQSVSRVGDLPQVDERIEQAVDDLDATIKDIRRSIFALGSAEAAADIQTEITRLVDRAAST